MSSKKSVNINKGTVTKRPQTNVIEISHEEDDDFDFPSEIQAIPGNTSDDVSLEWNPIEKGEYVVGNILQSNRMNLGGLAYVLRVDTPNGHIDVLLKRGGRVLEAKMSLVGATDGDRVAILFQGEGQAKPDQNPPRLWKVKKITK